MVTRSARGFTLLELLATVAVLSVLAAVAAPSFTQLIEGQRAKAATGDLFSSLLRTRSEAIKRNTEITLAPTTSASGWGGGWTIAHPTNTTAKLESHGAIAGATISGPTSVVFMPNGRVKGTSAPAFTVGVGASLRRCVEVDLSGRPYQKNQACVTNATP